MAARQLVIRLLWWVVLCGASELARADSTPLTPEALEKALGELTKQRDVLLARIISGSGHEQATTEFVALLGRRRELLAQNSLARTRVEQQRRTERSAEEQLRETTDYQAGWRCTFSPDPAHPVPSDEGRLRADWGKVLKVHTVRKPPKNELDDGEEVTFYEIAGQAERLFVLKTGLGTRSRSDFEARAGDLVLVCEGSRSSERDMPAPWQETRFIRSGMASRIAMPPRIAQKKRWNPRHITSTRYFWAIKDVRWRYPPEEFVLSHLQVSRDLGGGRFAIDLIQDKVLVIEVPVNLPRRELIVPDRWVWLILGQPRFDKSVKTLVMTVADVETQYVQER